MALALLVAHEPEANLWRITKGFPEFDCDGNPADANQAWRVVAKHACKVARIVNTDQFLKELGDPKKPEGEPSDEEELEQDAEATVSDTPSNDALSSGQADEATSTPPVE
jgi:hypothetical protein